MAFKIAAFADEASVFEGFDKLEAEDRSRLSCYTYPDSFSAFKAGVSALRELI